ncbi:putative lipid II flippase FtsW, partial [Thioflexithrix psekupsensis]
MSDSRVIYSEISRFDFLLGLVIAGLMLLGLVMVASASMDLAAQRMQQPFYYFLRQLAFAGMGVGMGAFIFLIPMAIWQRLSVALLLLGMGLLILVLIPGLGHEVNGSLRWLKWGYFQWQPSELVKLFLILYLAGYLVRRSMQIRTEWRGLMNALFVVIIVAGLILLQPDYGTAVVLFVTVMGMLFLAGVPMRQFLLSLGLVSVALSALVWLAPYRMARLTAFLDPWADPFNSGFQLTQALIAIGRGEWFGVGLGNSVQKLTYLPEAHTDFLFAILAEELGLFGVIIVIAGFAFLVLRTFWIAIQTERLGHYYSAYVCYGIGLLLGLQVSINLGVNMGLLPTKGLTLPLMSYGGSSLVTVCFLLAVLLRVDFETRQHLI